jgi:hypothetical protein
LGHATEWFKEAKGAVKLETAVIPFLQLCSPSAISVLLVGPQGGHYAFEYAELQIAFVKVDLRERDRHEFEHFVDNAQGGPIETSRNLF